MSFVKWFSVHAMALLRSHALFTLKPVSWCMAITLHTESLRAVPLGVLRDDRVRRLLSLHSGSCLPTSRVLLFTLLILLSVCTWQLPSFLSDTWLLLGGRESPELRFLEPCSWAPGETLRAFLPTESVNVTTWIWDTSFVFVLFAFSSFLAEWCSEHCTSQMKRLWGLSSLSHAVKKTGGAASQRLSWPKPETVEWAGSRVSSLGMFSSKANLFLTALLGYNLHALELEEFWQTYTNMQFVVSERAGQALALRPSATLSLLTSPYISRCSAALSFIIPLRSATSPFPPPWPGRDWSVFCSKVLPFPECHITGLV